jgi:hypothetical protein
MMYLNIPGFAVRDVQACKWDISSVLELGDIHVRVEGFEAIQSLEGNFGVSD